jgi:hypothetical protein
MPGIFNPIDLGLLYRSVSMICICSLARFICFISEAVIFNGVTRLSAESAALLMITL